MTVSISEEKINEIRNAADLIDIVSETVLLKKAGTNHIGLCPFHSEKTPSFTVRSDKQIFHCFGCGLGGDVFSFIMKNEGLSFPETVRQLAGRYGVDLPGQSFSPEQDRLIREREELIAINKLAMDYYHSTLLQRPAGKKALSYLTGRGISTDTIRLFRLGFAPAGWENLVSVITGKGYSQKAAEKAGLVTAKQNGFYDRFRSRVMFPIMNLQRQVIAFGGRVLDDSLPKYLNSPETPLFSKSRSLYGLHLAKKTCRELGSIFIVEGYMDLLALFQHGIENVAATLGTAMTSEHIRSLKGFANKAILVYDSDEAGLKAAQRSIAVMNKDLNEYRILVLPTGYDPDSYLQQFGPREFLQQAEKALGVFEFLIESAIKKHGLSMEGKQRIISEMETHMVNAKDSLDLSLYSKELAERIQVDQQAVLEAIRKRMPQNKSPQHHVSRDVRTRPTISRTTDRLEKRIITKMLQFPEKATALIESEQVLDFFEDNNLKMIGAKIIELNKTGKQPAARLLTNVVDPDQRRLITSLTVQDEPWHAEGWRKLIGQFIDRRNQQVGKTLSKKIKEAEAANDHELAIQLLAEKQRQAREKLFKPKESSGGKFL